MAHGTPLFWTDRCSPIARSLSLLPAPSNRGPGPTAQCLRAQDLMIYGSFGWGWAGQPPHKNIVHLNQPAVLLYHINEPATI